MRLQSIDVLAEHRLLDLGDHALVREVDALHLDLGGFTVEEIVQFLLGELGDGLVHIEEP
ncbi:hypothetical protein D3C73_1331740 [compost metagenome]